MYTIHKITLNPTVDFAADELKKYLRMMMPRCGEVAIDYDAKAEKGFRLGLMQDFGLDTSDAEDVTLDDIVYVETDANGGIIAGSNPGALLIAVYRYLRFCGCRWLFPGVDGEWIPVIEGLPAVSYRKKADYRYRGQCNKGGEYQQNMMEVIDFTPKIGMNSFMIEFDIPMSYYKRYYNHSHNTSWEPEPVNTEIILQWKRQCEVEMQKRGLHFHDMGHGWTAEPYGLVSNGTWETMDSIPEEVRPYLAQINGKRDLFGGVPLNTNICFSNPEARDIMVQAVADYAEKQNNVDFLHVWLSDGTRNHCECDACREKIVPDWYVILLNEIDAEMTKRGLNTHLVFIVYTDTFWAPKQETIHNPKRFTMLYAPITRLYCEGYGLDADESKVEPFKLNKNEYPKGMAACLGYLKDWKKVWPGDCFCYEYHFWIHQYYDPTGLYISKVIHDDIVALKKQGLNGIIEDGSQRSYFPTGLAFYVYGETLFDSSKTLEELTEDYYRHAFGEKWQEVLDYMRKVSACFDFEYMSGHCTLDTEKSKVFNPAMAERLAQVSKLTADFIPVIEANKNQYRRASSCAWRLLRHHADFLNYIAQVAIQRAVGDNEGAMQTMKRYVNDFSDREPYIATCYDFAMIWHAYRISGLFTNQPTSFFIN